MIKATYYRKYNRLTVEGHAYSAEPGRDLVCAGCSALVYTLAANVGQLEQTGQVRGTIVQLNAGSAEISCEPKRAYKAVVSRVMEAVCVGFEILATTHPQYISYEIHG